MRAPTMKGHGGGTQDLEIRHRRTLGRDGGEERSASVHCPRQARTVPVSECQACSQYLGTSVGAAHAPHVRCTQAADPVADLNLPGAVVADVDVAWRALKTPVSALMSHQAICVRPEVSIDEFALLVVEHGVSAMPVVDERGRPCGMVSKTDLLWDRYEDVEGGELAFDEDRPSRSHSRRTVAEIMTAGPLTVREDTPVAEAAARMASEGVHQLPVVDGAGQVVGILAAIDVVAWVARQSGWAVPRNVPLEKR